MLGAEVVSEQLTSAIEPTMAIEQGEGRKKRPNGRSPEEAWNYLLKAQKLILDQLDRDLARGNSVSLTLLEVMFRIDSAPDHKMRLRDIASSLITSRSSITRSVERLVQQGLVLRRESELDRRETFASLTPKGKSTLDFGMRIFKNSRHAYFSSKLSPEETEVLCRVFKRLSEDLIT